MKIGFFGINFGVAGDVDAMISIAKAAEASGIESVWTGEHAVLPDPRVAPSPSDPQIQKPHPPIVVGGMSRSGARRAARYGSGWFGFLTDIEATARSIEWIHGYISNGVRPGELGDIEISVTPPMRLTPDVVDRYGEIGVHRLIPVSNATTLDDVLRFVDKLGEIASR